MALKANVLTDDFTEWLGLVYIKRFLFMRQTGLNEYVYPKEASYQMTFPSLGPQRKSQY